MTLVPSEATRRRLLANGMQRVEIWSRGVDGQAFHPGRRDPALRESLGLGPDDPLLLYVGRLAPEKNLPALLAAFARLRQRLPSPLGERVRLAVVGDGPQLESFRAAAAGGGAVSGAQHGAALSRWYASADLFAFPSQSETFGNVVLEAQAAGLPVVGYDCQGVSERVAPGVDGLLAPPNGDLADGLELLCLNPEHAAAARGGRPAHGGAAGLEADLRRTGAALRSFGRTSASGRALRGEIG